MAPNPKRDRRSERADPFFGCLVGIGCAAGLLVSIQTLSPLLASRIPDVMEQRTLIGAEHLLLLIAPLGYLLVGWFCVRHWETVSQREVVLMCAVTLVGTLLTFVFLPVLPLALALLVGFWMLNGFGLTWLLRKLRRIMREANAE